MVPSGWYTEHNQEQVVSLRWEQNTKNHIRSKYVTKSFAQVSKMMAKIMYEIHRRFVFCI
jgi:hypothetical protein